MGIRQYTHVAIRVSDLERSVCFYRDLLGFTERSRYEGVGGPTAMMVGDPQAELAAVFLERDGAVVELQQLEGVDARNDHVGLGLSHIGFKVTDLSAVTATLQAAGAQVLEHSRYRNDDYRSEVVFVTDPDGTRLELIDVPAEFDLWRSGAPD